MCDSAQIHATDVRGTEVIEGPDLCRRGQVAKMVTAGAGALEIAESQSGGRTKSGRAGVEACSSQRQFQAIGEKSSRRLSAQLGHTLGTQPKQKSWWPVDSCG